MSTPDHHIFLSGIRGTQSRTNLFRPKELREVVFPGLGMIMHSLFWVKHTFYLGEQGYKIANQKSILLWADNDGPVYSESLLFYCIYSNMTTSEGLTVNAGQRAVRDWLFRRDKSRDGSIYAQIAANLRSLAETPTSPDYNSLIENSFAPWFRTRCEELNVDLEAELGDTVGPVLDISDPEERERALAETFVSAIGQIVKEHPPLRSGKSLQVISTTSNFAQRVYEVSLPTHRTIIANTNFKITTKEATALLEAVGRMENGEHFLRSLMFILYLDPTAHSRAEIEQQMRHLYDLVITDPNSIISEVGDKYQISAVDDRVVTGLDSTAFYWVLNFFMADGETIARELLNETSSPMSVGDVEEYFEDNPSRAEQYRSFFNYTSECRPYLSELVAELQSDKPTRMYKFIQALMDGLAEEREPAQLFIDLLKSQGTLEEASEGHYHIVTRPQNTNAASFYGIGPLISWAETIATSVQT